VAATETTSLRQSDDALARLREALDGKIAEEAALYFGDMGPDWVAAARSYFWDDSLQGDRVANLARHGVRPGVDRVLDMASGCGQFLIHSLDAGYDCIGLEPDPWRRDFVARKLDAMGRPLASGTYLARLRGPDGAEMSQKLMLAR